MFCQIIWSYNKRVNSSLNCARVSSQCNQNPEQDLAGHFLLNITQIQTVPSNQTTRTLRKDPAEQSQQQAQKKDNKKTQTQTQNSLPLSYKTPETLLNETKNPTFPLITSISQWLNPNHKQMQQMEIPRNLVLTDQPLSQETDRRSTPSYKNVTSISW